MNDATQLPVGIIGLGDIAQKAYLPALAAEPGLDLRIMTRDRAKLDRLGDAYRITRRYTDLEALIASGIRAAFVHAPTDQHVSIVGRLLWAGIDVYVDKPLDYTVEGARHLVELAETEGRSLMVGFNRRYAPLYANCKQRPRDFIVMQKDRDNLPEAVRSVIFDDFIHVVDTLRFLAPGEITRTEVQGRVVEGHLHHIVLSLYGRGFTALGIMNRMSGASEERLELGGSGTKYQIIDISETIEDRSGQRTIRPRPTWTSVANVRGIGPICRTFLASVRAGEVLSARDALKTHELCERIVRELPS